MGFLAKVFQKVKPKKKSKKHVTEVLSDEDEEGSILSVALEEQISQILDDEEIEDNSTEDEDNEYLINNNGDHGMRTAKKSKKKKSGKKTRKNGHKEDISITMSGCSLIFW